MCDWFGFGSHKMDLVWLNELKSFLNHILINVVIVLVYIVGKLV